MEITIVDAICGSGKSTWAKEMMSNDENNQYIYVTPFIDEIKSLLHNYAGKFSEPANLGKGKLNSLDELLLRGRNIATTHSLFKICTDKEINYITAQNYTLILDEVMDVVNTLPIEKCDYDILFSQHLVELDKSGKMIWINEEYSAKGLFATIKSLCKRESVYVIDGVCLVWTLPISMFKCFNRVYILTYDFKNQLQRYYYDLYNIKYNYFSVAKVDDVYKLTDYKKTYPNYDNIKICTDCKLNAIGSKEYNGRCTEMSKSWYTNNPNGLAVLKNNITNYFIHKCKAKSKDIIWTTFKNFKSALSGKGYTKSFLACNARAVNSYRDRHYIAYTVNIFMNPMLKKFFSYNNVTVDEDSYALSEMIQFIYRSAIRNGDMVYCYIPSKRMRELLTNSINNK